jgi:hypothetical protein
MRKSFSLTVLFLLSLTLAAQKNKEVPAFGKVEKEDTELKECSIDKDAEAMYLFDQGTVLYRKGLPHFKKRSGHCQRPGTSNVILQPIKHAIGMMRAKKRFMQLQSWN